MLYLLLAQLLNQFRFPDINTMKNILQTQRFTRSPKRLDVATDVLLPLWDTSILIDGFYHDFGLSKAVV